MKMPKFVGSDKAPDSSSLSELGGKVAVSGSAPVVCDVKEGWTYSRILKSFDVDSSCILHVRAGWLVFSSRSNLLEYCRLAFETLSVL